MSDAVCPAAHPPAVPAGDPLQHPHEGVAASEEIVQRQRPRRGLQVVRLTAAEDLARTGHD